MTFHIAISAGLSVFVLSIQLNCLRSLFKMLLETPAHFLSEQPDKGLPSTIQKWADLFKLSSTTPLAGIATREHIKDRIEDHVYALGPYRLLQKLAVLAPVIGVMLTGMGFVFLESQATELGSMAASLASGVLAGGFLAITNQILLYFAESRMIQVVDSMHHELATHWADLARSQGEPTTHFREAASRFDNAVCKLTALVGTFPSNAGSLTDRFLEVEQLARASVSTLQGLDQGLRASADNFRDVSSKLAKAASDEFVSAVERLQLSVGTLSSTADISNKSALELEKVTTSLSDFAGRYIKDYAGLSRRMQELVEQSSETINRFVQGLNQSATSISEPMLLTVSKLTQMGDVSEKSSKATQELIRVAMLLKTFVETTAQPAKDTFEQLQRMSTEISHSYAGLATILEKLSASGADQMESQQIFLQLIKRRALPAVEVLQRATGTFEDSAQSIAESSEQLAEILKRLAHVGQQNMSSLGIPDERLDEAGSAGAFSS